MKLLYRYLIVLFFLMGTAVSYGQKNPSFSPGHFVWKAGVARKTITPSTSVWMGGYASRTSPSEGAVHDLWAKALALEDAKGLRSVLVTLDLVAIPKDFSDKLRDKIKKTYGLEKAQIILNCSHTHSGPVVGRALHYIYPMKTGDWHKVDEYTGELEEMLFELVGESMKNMKPAKIYTQNGITRFQVNRRNNKENELTGTTSLKGPNDYAVPVMKVEGTDGNPIAIVFGYACHPTTLSMNRFSGDYPGFAQIELEKMYPGATALFFQGVGADQNPLPRRTIPLAKQYGKQLAAAVESVLSGEMKPQESRLRVKYKEVDIPLAQPLTIEQMQEVANRNDFEGRWAKGTIAEYKKEGSFIKTYPYPIQYWKLGNQSLFVMGGEVLVSYGIQLKEWYGQDIFVMAYANDVMGYIPSAKVIEEGGYEGDTAHRVYGLPAKWDPKIEDIILGGIKELVINTINTNQ